MKTVYSLYSKPLLYDVVDTHLDLAVTDAAEDIDAVGFGEVDVDVRLAVPFAAVVGVGLGNIMVNHFNFKKYWVKLSVRNNNLTLWCPNIWRDIGLKTICT